MIDLATLSPTDQRLAAKAIANDPYLQRWVELQNAGYASFRPRPDRPELFDEQTAYIMGRDRMAFMVAGNASGKTTASGKKCGDFLLYGHAPPRRDTPFWIISESYDITCDVCWGEKLLGQGFLPECEIDWNGIVWHSQKGNRPKSVPLKPWPESRGGDPKKNWRIEFKSFEQGWTAMQARSIGGFWFSEQFPLELFVEVLRGCRDCMFPGGQFAEFTPLQPDLCIWLEKIMENPPEGWRFYRGNTECNRPNLEAGWYDDFFATVPDEMLETRRIGALATFEGAIYTSFNRAVHVVGNERIAYPFLPGMVHHRGIDWGASEEHPFACVWACHDGAGTWFIYDEYWSNDQSRITQDHAVEVLARSLAWGWPVPTEIKHPSSRMKPIADAVQYRLAEIRPDAEFKANQQHIGTFADPSRPGEINAFNQMGIYVQPAMNEVYKGIDAVRSLLKINPFDGQPRVFIHERCKHAIEEFRKYRWMRGKKPTGSKVLNPKAGKPVPLKRDDDTCFIAATEVQLPNGGVKTLGEVRKGDVLLSHLGEAVALSDAICTGIEEVWQATLSDGSRIIGTANHMLAADDKEWVPLCESKRRWVNVANCRRSSSECRITGVESKRFGIEGSSGLDTRIASTSLPNATTQGVLTDEPSIYTGGCIRTLSGQFQRLGTFTTLTAMWTTIDQKICGFSLRPLTRRNTFRRGQSAIASHSLLSSSSVSNAGAISPLSGTKPKNGNFARQNALVCHFGKTGTALYAEPLSPVTAHTSGKLAGRRANVSCEVKSEKRCTPPDGLPASTASQSTASCAASLSPQEARKLARRNVHTLCVVEVRKLPGTQPVYCLATSDGTFFANGVLVHNCDAIRYCIYSATMQRGAAPGSCDYKTYVDKRKGVQLDRGTYRDGMAATGNGHGWFQRVG